MDKNAQAQAYVDSLPKIKVASEMGSTFTAGVPMDERLRLMAIE